MAKPFLKQCYWVVPKGNDLILYDPNGNEIWGQVDIKVRAELDSLPVAVMRCVVNIAKDESEMRAKIEELNKPVIHGG